MKKQKNKTISEKFYDWYMNVRWIEGLSSIIYIYIFMIFIELCIIGLKNDMFKNYFEIMVIFAFLIMYISRLDIKISNSDNGFFSLTNWIMVVLFIIGLIRKDYGLYYAGFKILGFFIAIYIILIILPYFTEAIKNKN